MMPRSSIEQWVALRAVVEAGSFAAAAEVLHKSQSSVSYAVARLQEAIGLPLVEAKGRRAVLTDVGQALLHEMVPIIDQMLRIERRGRGVAAGDPVHLRLVVDALFPRARLFAAIEESARVFPNTEIHVIESVRQTVNDVPRESYDLAVLFAAPKTSATEVAAEIDLVAVARADHPMFAAGFVVSPAALAQFPMVEMLEVAPRDVPAVVGRQWRMSTIEAARDTVLRGLCYGWLPAHVIAADLARGVLRRIPLQRGAVRQVALGLYAGDVPPAQAAAADVFKGLLLGAV